LSKDWQYRELIEGEWKLSVLPDVWSGKLWQEVLGVIGQQAPDRHPQTVRLECRERSQSAPLFLKVFHPPSGIDAAKDFCRSSKAFRFLRQSVALAAVGFLVPTTVAAGEERTRGRLKRAFVLTAAVPGEPAPEFLRHRYSDGLSGLALAEKRLALESLGREIRCLHDAGFVHGDLVPTNIVIATEPGGGRRFYLMDNDRTRRYSLWWPQSLWKRNLVQLNRIPLPGITLQDRMRFFRAYSGWPDWSGAERKLLAWLERKTRQRRKECDGVDPGGSFRKLMTWKRETT
jgi:lipopolysaccharide kinase (Kdo/WaaP) family protein